MRSAKSPGTPRNYVTFSRLRVTFRLDNHVVKGCIMHASTGQDREGNSMSGSEGTTPQGEGATAQGNQVPPVIPGGATMSSPAGTYIVVPKNSDYEAKCRTFLGSQGVPFEHLVFEQSCHSVADAARAANAREDQFVKNVCMIGPDGGLIVAIVRGDERASTKSVGKALGHAGPPRTATPDEILTITGYPCGGTPSFGYEATFILDPKVLEQEVIYTGGGSEKSLTKISPKDIQQILGDKARVASVRKK